MTDTATRLTPTEQATLAKLRAGTHVVVPAEPTEAMETAFYEAHEASDCVFAGPDEWWPAVLQASQEDG